MNLSDAIERSQLLELHCTACESRTKLDPAFFAARRGLKATFSDLEKKLVCPACGSSAITLSSSQDRGL